HDWIPRKTVFQLRQMIDGDFTAKKFTPIVSTGTIVDHCPRKTVKILQDRATAELCRYRVKTEVELLPLVANPHPLLQRLASTQSVAALIAIVATTSNAAKRKALRNALLHVAIERNQPRHIDQLLTLGAQQSHKIQQKTPIMLAAEKKHWEIVAILAKYPTDPNDRAQYSIALVAVAEHREQMALAIQLAKQIQNPILRLRHEGDNNRSALYFAIYYQSDALLEAILAEQNPDDTEFSEKLLLAFEYAFKYQNANAIKRLMVFCRDPINLLMRATTLAEEAGNWAIFNIVYDFVQSKKIVLPQEILIDLLPKLMMKNDAQLIASLLKNNTTFPVEEKNALDNMMQKFNETKESGRLTKTLLVELLQIIHRAVPAISAHHQKLHQLYTQTCALPENTFTPNAVTALFTILEEIAQKRWENIASLLDYLMLITLCETREIKAVQAITADIMSHYNPELKIKKLYGCFLAYQCVMHGFSGSITRHEPVAFILAHLNHDDHFFITQYVSENFVSAKKTTPLLNKLQNHSAQIDKKQTACLNAYRALRMAVLERNPTTPAEFSQVVADWKKAPNDFFMQKTNGAVLRESDDMQNSGCCGLFEPPSHGGFLLGLSRSFTDTANRALVGTAYVN
ncbi:MAG TPA: hypothetical protein VI844_01185, partial [Coxiellaceae bacterium]|nr:hypothetical protein [Coxiellaceae bacterium]